MDKLVETQASALAEALGMAASGGNDRFLISAAVLAVIAAAAEDRPMLCLVDDAQWLDGPLVERHRATARAQDRRSATA